MTTRALVQCEPIVPPIRRDIAAMTLALYAIRTWMTGGRAAVSDEYAEHAVTGAIECLDWGSAFCDDLILAIPRTRGRGELRDPRLIRARLALLIRTVLRAENGYYLSRPAWTTLPRCPKCDVNLSWMPPKCVSCGEPWRRRPIVPLYRQAPPYDGRTAKERRSA